MPRGSSDLWSTLAPKVWKFDNSEAAAQTDIGATAEILYFADSSKHTSLAAHSPSGTFNAVLITDHYI
jgi:hypothetical protein